MTAGKPSPPPIYHLMRIIQPTTNEKPRLCPFRGFSATPRQSLVRLRRGERQGGSPNLLGNAWPRITFQNKP